MSYDYLEAKRRNDFLEEVNKNLVIECEALKSGQGLLDSPRIIDQCTNACSRIANGRNVLTNWKQTKSAFGQNLKVAEEENLVTVIQT